MQEQMIARAKDLLAQGKVSAVLGWKIGEFAYDLTPGIFYTAEQLDNEFVYNDLCAANLSKYLVNMIPVTEGNILVFLKPCDTYSFQQLIKEHRIPRDRVYAIGIPCEGKLDADKMKAMGAKGILGVATEGAEVTVYTMYGEKKFTKLDVMAERCLSCKSKKHVIYDELIGEDGEVIDSDRFDQVEALEAMTPDERFAFWQDALSRCIRCNACRNVCPACTCEKCVFDNPKSGVSNKAAADSFEEKMFHIIRAFHVAGRCTDCGECSRVCPQNIPLHLLNRKFIKDINEFYGDYQAGEDMETVQPLTSYQKGDCEPNVIYKEGK